MTKKIKFWSGVIALLPALTMVAFTIHMLSVVFYSMNLQSQGIAHSDATWPLAGIVITGVVVAISGVTAFIFYLMHIMKNKSLSSDERTVWIIVVVFASLIAIPVYWYMKIYKPSGPVTTASTV